MEFSIDRLAALAKLSLDEKEKKRLETDLAGILAYVDQLREVDTDGVEEITHAPPETNVLRDDTVPEKIKQENTETVALLRYAFPENEEGYIRVPLVINKSSK